MIIEITNSYHGTTEIAEEESLDVAKNKHISGLEVTAGNLAENEVEDDWADYYATYEEAEQATYDDILNQLKSEVAYKVIEQPMTIREVMVINTAKVISDTLNDMVINKVDRETAGDWQDLCNEYVLDNLPTIKGYDIDNEEHTSERFDLALALASDVSELFEALDNRAIKALRGSHNE